jgi:hypothetical protein
MASVLFNIVFAVFCIAACHGTPPGLSKITPI